MKLNGIFIVRALGQIEHGTQATGELRIPPIVVDDPQTLGDQIAVIPGEGHDICQSAQAGQNQQVEEQAFFLLSCLPGTEIFCQLICQTSPAVILIAVFLRMDVRIDNDVCRG